jgi:hypothetical protein
VGLTRRNGKPKARLLDLGPGRSCKAYADWLPARGNAFTDGVGSATLDPFRGHCNAIRDELDGATAELDAFHIVRLGLHAMEETRRRGQQEQLGHRDRKHDPLYRMPNALRAVVDKLTPRHVERIEAGLHAGDPHHERRVVPADYRLIGDFGWMSRPAARSFVAGNWMGRGRRGLCVGGVQ